MTPEQIAHVAHEANRVCQIEMNDPLNPASPSWEEIDESVRQKYIYDVGVGLVGRSPYEHHMDWMNTRLAQGWTYGLIKDADRKTHPCLVPWAELPLDERVKDELFIGIVRSLAHSMTWA